MRQRLAWNLKEGDHKVACKLRQRDRAGEYNMSRFDRNVITFCPLGIEGKSDKISKKDASFFSDLVVLLRETRRLGALFRRLANEQLPSARPFEIVLSVDFTVVPPAFTVKSLKDFDKPPQRTTGACQLPCCGGEGAQQPRQVLPHGVYGPARMSRFRHVSDLLARVLDRR